eukprot:4785553-Amphidinium_carterae.2
MHVQRASLYDSRGLAYRWLALHVRRIAADRDWAKLPPREVGTPPNLEDLEIIHLGMHQLTLAELTSELRLEEQQAASRPPLPILQSPVQHGVPLMGREALQHVQNTWMQIWSEHGGAQLPDASRLPDLPGHGCPLHC